jgi:hypothetical protein
MLGSIEATLSGQPVQTGLAAIGLGLAAPRASQAHKGRTSRLVETQGLLDPSGDIPALDI